MLQYLLLSVVGLYVLAGVAYVIAAWPVLSNLPPARRMFWAIYLASSWGAMLVQIAQKTGRVLAIRDGGHIIVATFDPEEDLQEYISLTEQEAKELLEQLQAMFKENS